MKKIKSLAKYTAVGLMAVLLLVNVGLAFAPTKVINIAGDYIEAAQEIAEETLGAFPGPDIYHYLFLHDTFVQGGAVLASSTSVAADLLQASDILNFSVLDYTPGNLAVTLTLPASTTLNNVIKYAGDCTDFRIRNLDSVSATSTTIAAGTGIDLVENENGDVVIEGGNEAQLKFCREADTDVTVYVDEYIAAD